MIILSWHTHYTVPRHKHIPHMNQQQNRHQSLFLKFSEATNGWHQSQKVLKWFELRYESNTRRALTMTVHIRQLLNLSNIVFEMPKHSSQRHNVIERSGRYRHRFQYVMTSLTQSIDITYDIKYSHIPILIYEISNYKYSLYIHSLLIFSHTVCIHSCPSWNESIEWFFSNCSEFK